jgi:signal transduction histidine kinase
MSTLLERLQPEDLHLKLRILSALHENPFLDTSRKALGLRFCGEAGRLARALDDLCACGALARQDGGYAFRPPPGLLAQLAAVTADVQREESQSRRTVAELAELGRLRDQLAVTHQEVAGILEMVPAGVLLVDRFGNLLKSNALGRRLTGLPDEGGRLQVCQRLGLQRERVLAEAFHEERDLERPVAISSKPFRLAGSQAGAVIILQDISHRRALEAQVEQTREAFFSMIRHELRRPLLTIQRTLEAGFGASAPSDNAADLDHARSAAAQLAGMVDDMLLLARLEKDPVSACEPEPLSLCYLLSAADLGYRDRAAQSGVALRTLPPEEDVRFKGDERRLTQVIGNLLDNALRHTPPSGRVTLSGARRNGHVEIRIADTGPGIPEADLERIFDRFHQADSGQGRPQGLGLGLAICRHIVEAHGGRISAGNRPEGGAEFVVAIPVGGPAARGEDPRPLRRTA